MGLAFKDYIDRSYDFCLVFSSDKTWIQSNKINCGPVYVDFINGKHAHRRQYGGGKRQAIAKAVGLNRNKNLHVLDVTGGYAGDAFVLATQGAILTVVERSAVLFALIHDGMIRAKIDSDVRPIVQRMRIYCQDSIDYLQRLTPVTIPDVIYIDPMYPQKQKSAAANAKMQLLHLLIGPDTNANSLLELAVKNAKKRVVVKRPKTAPSLSEHNLVGEVSSKNTRYDIYRTT